MQFSHSYLHRRLVCNTWPVLQRCKRRRYTLTHMQAGTHSCRVAPMEGGLVRACFRPEKAGPYSLIVKLDPSTTKAKSAKPTTLNMTLNCIAGPMDISKCKIDRGDSSIVAGRTGSLTISCCDIFGNPTCNVPVVPLTLVPSGQLRVWWARPPKSSTLTLSFSSREAGKCTLGIAAPKGGASIAASPVAIEVLPDGPCAAQCTATPRCGRRIITPETATLTAGAPLLLHMHSRCVCIWLSGCPAEMFSM